MKVELSDEAKRQARDENAWWCKNRDHQRIFTEELRVARKVLKKLVRIVAIWGGPREHGPKL